MLITHLKKALVLMMVCASIASTAFAEDAPVYDVDSYPPQFDGEAAPDTTPNVPDGQFSADEQQQFVPVSPSPRVPSLDQRIARLEQQIKNMQRSDASSRADSLQNQVQLLRGQVEDLTHQLQQLQEQQKTMYSDLDRRLSGRPANGKAGKAVIASPQASAMPGVSSAAASAKSAANLAKPAVVAAVAPDQPNVAEEQQIYQAAYNLIKAKKYSEAATQLQKMLQKYPSGLFAANAHYWLGELYGLMGKNEQAIEEFANVIRNYPESPKVSEAQLKLGLIFVGLLKWPDAKLAFKKVINRYPGTSSARLAAEQLQQIKQAGH